MNGIEEYQRMRVALRRKMETNGWDMETTTPGGIGTLGDMIDTILVDAQLIVAKLVPIEKYEQ